MKDDIYLAARDLRLMRRRKSAIMSVGNDKEADRHDQRIQEPKDSEVGEFNSRVKEFES